MDNRTEPHVVAVTVAADNRELFSALYLLARPGDEQKAVAHAKLAALHGRGNIENLSVEIRVEDAWKH